MKTKIVWMMLAALAVIQLQGCAAALVAPVVGGMNLARNGPVVMKLEGKPDGIAAFKRAAIAAGGSVPKQTADFAEASFTLRGTSAEIQALGGVQYSVTVTPTAAKSWDFKDTIQHTADDLAAGMAKAGFTVVERTRDNGLGL